MALTREINDIAKTAQASFTSEIVADSPGIHCFVGTLRQSAESSVIDTKYSNVAL